MAHSGPSFPSVCPLSPRPPTPVDMGWNDGDHHLPEDPLEKRSLGHLWLTVGLEHMGGAARGEEEESLAFFERKEGQVGKMTLLGCRSLEVAPRGSVFLGDMRVPSDVHLICIFPAPPATELKIWSEEGLSW